MKKKILIQLILISMFAINFEKESFAWDNHRLLSQFAAENSVLDTSKGAYLKTLGFDAGLSEMFTWNNKSQQALVWLQDGAESEDAGSVLQMICGYGRSFNHFHNPLKPWDSAGLNDYVPNLCPPLIPPRRHVIGESLLLWAQDSAKQATYTDLEGDCSWEKTRDCVSTKSGEDHSIDGETI